MSAETQIIISAKDLATDTFRRVGLASEGLIKIFERSKELIPFVGSGLAVDGLKELIEHQVEYMDSAGKMAQKTGLTTESWLSYQYAASLADVPTETMAKGMERLSKNMVAAAQGSGNAYDAFTSMGISLKDNSGQLKSVDGMMMEVANKFGTYSDGAEKTALAMAIFGKAGAEMIPLLNRGASELENMRQEAESMGYVFSEDVARQAEEVNDNFKRLHTRTGALATIFVSGMLPALVDTSSYLLNTASNAETLRDKLEAVDKTLRGISYVAVATKNVGDMVGSAIYHTLEAAGWAVQGEMNYAWGAMKKLNTSGWEDLNDINRAYQEIWLGNKPKGHSEGTGEQAHEPKKRAPLIAAPNDGSGASTIKTLREEALKAETALQGTYDIYEELRLTLAGDTLATSLSKLHKDFNKEQLDTLRELQKIEDERKALAAKGKLTGEAAGLLDRAKAAVQAKLYWLPFVDEEKKALATIQDDLEKMAHNASHATIMSELTGQGVWEAKAKANAAKYDGLRMDPKIKQYSPDWDAEQAAATVRLGQDKAKATAQQRAELAQLTGTTREYYLAQADVLAIEMELATTEQERALKAKQFERTMAQANGDWINASRVALDDYKRDAEDTWKQVHDTVGSCATDMESYMVESAMGTKDAWSSALTSIERDFIRMLTRMGPMNKAMGLAGSFIESSMSSLFGGTSWAGNTTQADVAKAYAEAGGTQTYRAYADGGPTSVGWTLTGEKGPELRYNPTPGYTFTADQTASMLGGGSTVTQHSVSVVQHFDFRGADTGVETRVRSMMGAVKAQTKRELLAEIQALNDRGGRFAKNSGRRQ